jgi:hypothetical protein
MEKKPGARPAARFVSRPPGSFLLGAQSGKRTFFPKQPAPKDLGKIVSVPLGHPPQPAGASTRALPFGQSIQRVQKCLISTTP